MDTIKQCFDVILSSDREASRQAARRVRKLVYSAADRSKYSDIKKIIDNASLQYTKIIEDWRQENFVMAISVIYYLHDKEAEPDFLFPLLFELLQHPRGNIRYAAVRMLGNELGPLTVYIRVPDFNRSYFKKLTPAKADDILFALFISLQKLSEALWRPIYKRYKYIDSLPASSYKSVQMVLAELEGICGPKYINKMIKDYQLAVGRAEG